MNGPVEYFATNHIFPVVHWINIYLFWSDGTLSVPSLSTVHSFYRSNCANSRLAFDLLEQLPVSSSSSDEELDNFNRSFPDYLKTTPTGFTSEHITIKDKAMVHHTQSYLWLITFLTKQMKDKDLIVLFICFKQKWCNSLTVYLQSFRQFINIVLTVFFRVICWSR